MYLSRINLNPSRLATKKLLTSPPLTKHLVLSACGPEAGGGGDNRVLWRIDQDQHRLQLYVVSPDRPDFTGVVEQAGWPTTHTWDTAQYGPFLDRLEAGQQWRFRLTANPVRSVAGTHGQRGRVTPCLTRDAQEQWLLDRAAKLGVTIPQRSFGEVVARDFALSDRASLTFTRRSEGAKGKVTITKVTYDGILEVTDPSELRTALETGIGRARGYGCGLLTLAPAHA